MNKPERVQVGNLKWQATGSLRFCFLIERNHLISPVHRTWQARGLCPFPVAIIAQETSKFWSNLPNVLANFNTVSAAQHQTVVNEVGAEFTSQSHIRWTSKNVLLSAVDSKGITI